MLVVPRAALEAWGSWRGIRTSGLERYLDLIGSRLAEYRPRTEVEADPAWKQVIPYLVLRDGGRIFLMRRTRAGADARLHDRYSIGVGGHVHPADRGLAGGLHREWGEELDATFRPEPTLLGILNDDSQPVGEVHVGVVFQADAAGRPVRVRETDKLSGEFVDPTDVRTVYDRLEGWSQLVFDVLAIGEPAEPVPAR